MDCTRKIKLALVDSGINKDALSTDTHIIDINLFGFVDCTDKTSHGTTCAKIITQKVQEIELFNVKVCDNTTTTPNRLISAIKWCADHNMDIINVSIGCNDVALYYAFDQVCSYAHQKGCIIVASASNMRNICYPAYNNNVIGVGTLTSNADIYVYKGSSYIKFYCNGYHHMEKGYTSFAAANMSSYILHLMCNGYKITSSNAQIVISQHCKEYEYGDPIIECIEFPYSTEYTTPDFSQVCRKMSQKYSFLGYQSETELLRKYRNECVIDIEDLWSIELNETSMNQNAEFNMCLPAGIHTNHRMIVSDIPMHLSRELSEILDEEYIVLESLLYPLHNFSSDINKSIMDMNVLFNQNADKKLFINLGCQTNVDMLIELFRRNQNSNKSTVVLGNDPLLQFFGFMYTEKQQSVSLAGNYIAAIVDSISRNNVENILMGIDLKEHELRKYNYDIQARKDILYFTSQVLGYNPDSIFIVVDQYTNIEFLTHVIKLVKGITNCTIDIVLKDAFILFNPLYYIVGANYPRELGIKLFDIQYSNLKSIGFKLNTYNTIDSINEFSQYILEN